MTTKKTRAAVASSADVEAAADELLRKGNAVDAVVAGVFAACAVAPSALLGPVQILIGGAGAGLRALDGRVRQPGIGAPRPRGFQSGEDVPDGARVGVPWLPATLSVALATSGTATFAQVLGPATALAKGSPRAEVLARIAARGPRAIEERPISTELLAFAGRASGGLLTTDDLASPRPEAITATRTPASRARGADPAAAPRAVVTLPWAHVDADDGPPHPVAPSGVDVGGARAIAAVDRYGTFALACWDEGADGAMLEELGLRAPFLAEPVRRGQTRVRPGEARPAPAPVAFVVTSAGPEVAFAAFGARDGYDVLAQAIGSFVEADIIEAHGEARLVALAHAGGAASVLRS